MSSIITTIYKIISQDKLLHFSIAALLTIWLQRLISVELSVFIVFAMIIGKEVYDLKIKKTKFDYIDILFGLFGLLAGLL